MPADYLHNHKQFPELIRIVAERKSIDPALVEKDYWIMHSLYGLQKLGLTACGQAQPLIDGCARADASGIAASHRNTAKPTVTGQLRHIGLTNGKSNTFATDVPF
jgi:hypothetical protein